MKRQHFTCLKQFRYNKRIWYFKDQSSEINILLQQANVQLVCKYRSQRTCAKRFGLSHVAKACAVLKQVTVVTALVTATRPSVVLYAQHSKTKYWLWRPVSQSVSLSVESLLGLMTRSQYNWSVALEAVDRVGSGRGRGDGMVLWEEKGP